MRFMVYFWIVLGLFLAGLGYVRFAPSDPARWHQPPNVVGDKTFGNGATRRVTIGKDGLKRLAAVAEADPRTYVLAGSVQDGMITFVTRTRVVGFPDYTTAIQDGEDLGILARSRFGRRDFGVNAARIERWIEALTAF